MRVDDFDFELPDAAIALRPASPRDAARLLEVTPRPGGPPIFADRIVRDLPGLLRRGDALVVNDTRVVPARLSGLRRRGDSVARHRGHVAQAAVATRSGRRSCARPSGSPSASASPSRPTSRRAALAAEVLAREAGEVILRFDRGGLDLDRGPRCGRATALAALHRGQARRATLRIASITRPCSPRQPGAVAAPTAGLHFTPDLLAALAEAGIALHRVTLHVGAGTFLPVKTESTEDHVMHAEDGEVERRGRRRTQRRAGARRPDRRGRHDLAPHPRKRRCRRPGQLRAFSGETSIFITPGYRFRAVDALMTNFHLPRSTLFMLVSAFSGLSTMRAAYAHAIALGLSLLFLRRRQSALAAARPGFGSARMNSAFRLRDPGTRRRGPDRRDPHGRAVPIRTPAFMPVGTAAHRQGHVSRTGEGARRRHRARQHLSSDDPARCRAGRRARRPAPLHELAAPDPHRFGRLPGHVARQAAAPRRDRA